MPYPVLHASPRVATASPGANVEQDDALETGHVHFDAIGLKNEKKCTAQKKKRQQYHTTRQTSE